MDQKLVSTFILFNTEFNYTYHWANLLFHFFVVENSCARLIISENYTKFSTIWCLISEVLGSLHYFPLEMHFFHFINCTDEETKIMELIFVYAAEQDEYRKW